MEKRTFHTYSFEKLDVWQVARKLRKKIYNSTSDFPKNEMFGLTSQIRKSVSSITANLAEGSGRASDKDTAHFTNISYASALETVDHLIAAYDLGYLEKKKYADLRLLSDEVINKLNALYRYQVNRQANLKDFTKD